MIRRLALLASLLVSGGGCAVSSEGNPGPPEARLHYLATAEQLGVVSFRDPLGAISPDGKWLAWSVQHHLYLRPVPTGPLTTFPGDSGLIAQLLWSPDSKSIALQRNGTSPRWWSYSLATGQQTPLFGSGLKLTATAASGPREALPDNLRHAAWSRDGQRLAGVLDVEGGSELWSFPLFGGATTVVASIERLSFPVFAPDGSIVCLSFGGKSPRISTPCGEKETEVEAYGPMAYSPDGASFYYAGPDADSAVALFRSTAPGVAGKRLTTFARDAYAPTAAADGSVLFKTQNYRTVIGVVNAEGGPVRPLSTFRSETPSWSPDGRFIGVTYGTWRRVMDDFRYPDIAQEIGTIGTDPEHPASEPAQVIEASPSEDQSLAWSPNGKWIVFHSHRDLGDDIWLKPADGTAPARRITDFKRGAETGWPRWSADGKWIAFDAAPRVGGNGRSSIYLMAINQETGAAERERKLELAGYAGEAVHAEWLPDSKRLVILAEDGAGKWSLLQVGAEGGTPRLVHRWASEHRFAGHGVSPDGKWVAFIAPAGGYFQLFRVPVAGGKAEQLTFDPSNKSQPAYSPDGSRIALTIWEYQVQFWVLAGSEPGREP